MPGSIGLGIRAFFGVVFFMSAASKVFDVGAFVQGVRDYRVIPGPVTAVAALAILGLECYSVVLLAGHVVLAWPLIVLLLSVFAMAQVVVLSRKATVPCHCFNATELVDGGSLARTCFLIAIAGVGWLTDQAIDPTQAVDPAVAAISATMSAVGMIWAKAALATVRELSSP